MQPPGPLSASSRRVPSPHSLQLGVREVRVRVRESERVEREGGVRTTRPLGPCRQDLPQRGHTVQLRSHAEVTFRSLQPPTDGHLGLDGKEEGGDCAVEAHKACGVVPAAQRRDSTEAVAKGHAWPGG